MGGMSDLGGGGRLRSGRPVRGAPPEAGAAAERLDERAGEDRRPAIQFLIDEDVTPRLHEVAVARGYNAYHVPRAEQIRLFEAAIEYIEAGRPPLDMMNAVLVADEDSQVVQFEIP